VPDAIAHEVAEEVIKRGGPVAFLRVLYAKVAPGRDQLAAAARWVHRGAITLLVTEFNVTPDIFTLAAAMVPDWSCIDVLGNCGLNDEQFHIFAMTQDSPSNLRRRLTGADLAFVIERERWRIFAAYLRRSPGARETLTLPVGSKLGPVAMVAPPGRFRGETPLGPLTRFTNEVDSFGSERDHFTWSCKADEPANRFACEQRAVRMYALSGNRVILFHDEGWLKLREPDGTESHGYFMFGFSDSGQVFGNLLGGLSAEWIRLGTNDMCKAASERNNGAAAVSSHDGCRCMFTQLARDSRTVDGRTMAVEPANANYMKGIELVIERFRSLSGVSRAVFERLFFEVVYLLNSDPNGIAFMQNFTYAMELRTFQLNLFGCGKNFWFNRRCIRDVTVAGTFAIRVHAFPRVRAEVARLAMLLFALDIPRPEVERATRLSRQELLVIQNHRYLETPLHEGVPLSCVCDRHEIVFAVKLCGLAFQFTPDVLDESAVLAWNIVRFALQHAPDNTFEVRGFWKKNRECLVGGVWPELSFVFRPAGADGDFTAWLDAQNFGDVDAPSYVDKFEIDIADLAGMTFGGPGAAAGVAVFSNVRGFQIAETGLTVVYDRRFGMAGCFGGEPDISSLVPAEPEGDEAAQVENTQIDGDAEITQVDGDAEIAQVDADAEITQIEITQVDADGENTQVEITQIDGDAEITQADGDAEITQIDGDAEITQVEADGDEEAADESSGDDEEEREEQHEEEREELPDGEEDENEDDAELPPAEEPAPAEEPGPATRYPTAHRFDGLFALGWAQELVQDALGAPGMRKLYDAQRVVELLTVGMPIFHASVAMISAAWTIVHGATLDAKGIAKIIDDLRGPRTSTLKQVRNGIRVLVQLGAVGVFAETQPPPAERRLHVAVSRPRRVIAAYVCRKGTPKDVKLWVEQVANVDTLPDDTAKRDRVLTVGAAFHAVHLVKGGDVGQRRLAKWFKKWIPPQQGESPLTHSTVGVDLKKLRDNKLLA
jgi:hypothetical protein